MRSERRTTRTERGAKFCAKRQLTLEILEPRNLLTGITMTGEEQLVLELINRAREAPAAEASRFGIGLNDGLPPGTISRDPKPPLAPNQILINTAVAHSWDMIRRSFFSHTNPDGLSAGDRIRAAGYPWIGYAENIAWGTHMDAEGFHEILFESPSHRVNILRHAAKEIGIGIRYGSALKGTEDFGLRRGDAFITGIAFTDEVVRDDFYTIGEGASDVNVTARSADGRTVVSTVTGPTGGYSLQVPPGTYSVTATRSDLETQVVSGVAIGSENRKVDFEVVEYTPIPPVAMADRTMTTIGQSVVIDVLANDSGDKHQVVVVSQPGHGQATVNASTGAIQYSPQPSYRGFDKIRYKVLGSTGLPSNTVTVEIAVIDLQDCPWQNPADHFDVNASGAVTAEDVLTLIYDLNANGARLLPSPSPQSAFPQPYLDVTGEGLLSPRDILGVINRFNDVTAGEGEWSAANGALSASSPTPVTAKRVGESRRSHIRTVGEGPIVAFGLEVGNSVSGTGSRHYVGSWLEAAAATRVGPPSRYELATDACFAVAGRDEPFSLEWDSAVACCLVTELPELVDG